MESAVKETLKSLCCDYGWFYGVLWQFDQHNPMFLTLAEAFENQISGLSLIDDMLLQVHILGQDIVGEAVFTGKDQWIHSEAWDESLMGSVSCQDNEVGTELRGQFASGIKTIVAIPLESHGVVQFGSTKKMAEGLEFSALAKKLLLENINRGRANAPIPLLYENYGSDEWFDLLFSNGISICKDQVLRPSGTSDNLMGEICDSVQITYSPASVSKMPHEAIDTSVDPDVVLSDMVSLEHIFPSETTPSSPFVFPPFQRDSHIASTYRMEELFDAESLTRLNSDLLMGDQLLDGVKSDIPEISSSANWSSARSNEWHVPQLDSVPPDLAVASKDFSRLSCVSTSSSLNQGRTGTPVNNEAHLMQGIGTDNIIHTTPGKPTDPFPCLAKDFYHAKGVTSHLQSCPPMIGSCVSGISELDAIYVSGSRKGLFSELGLDQLLRENVQDSVSVDRGSYDDRYSTSKKRKLACGSTGGNQCQSEVFSCLSEKISAFQQHHQKVIKSENLGFERDFMLKTQAGLWIDDSYSINAGSSTNTTQAKRTQESTKPIKKRARPGESTRPRPKDRQQFQDRLGELRKMIPNTGKCSIDALLDGTIKHMLFLQSVAEYAEKLKRIADEKEKGSISKNNANGVTWAFEMCDQAMMCPIKVEDVGSSGQMLIEMLCENGGTFLEIADTIRGFGLCILNGSTEDRNDKTWAHFIVEAKATSSVTRVDVFWSLAQHLQQSTTTSGINCIDHQLPIKVADITSGAQSEYLHQQNLPRPILADAHR